MLRATNPRKSIRLHLGHFRDLRGKRILEIGCGQGEFLRALCGAQGSTGLGYDPAFDAARTPQVEGIDIIAENFASAAGKVDVDFIVCRMTLEHIAKPHLLLVDVRMALADRDGVTLCFQVPAVERILDEAAFWDIYFEHSNYFGESALTRLFAGAGFEVMSVTTEYDGQYLTLEARPCDRVERLGAPGTVPPGLGDHVSTFTQRTAKSVSGWRAFLAASGEIGESVMLWGGGSKAVAFLQAIGRPAGISGVVDINPLKWGTFLAGSGQQCLAPSELQVRPPDWIIVMNPIYVEEIGECVRGFGLESNLLPVTLNPNELQDLRHGIV